MVIFVGYYILDVLCRQQIKLFQVVSSSELHKYNLSVKTLYTLDKPNESFVTDSQSIEAMFPKRNLTKYVGNISINLAIHS